MSAQQSPIDLLAAYLTGPEVGHHSIGLEMPPGGLQKLRERAERFFELRAALGITGYATVPEARSAIEQSLQDVP